MYIGDVALIDSVIVNTIAGTRVDPTTVVFGVHTPDDVTTNYEYGIATEVTKLEIGLYRLRLPLSQSGNYAITTTTTIPGAMQPTGFVVLASPF